MNGRALAYLGFTLSLGAVFAGIVAYYFGARRKDRVEAPKHRMLRDDDGAPDDGQRSRR